MAKKSPKIKEAALSNIQIQTERWWGRAAAKRRRRWRAQHGAKTYHRAHAEQNVAVLSSIHFKI
jgi:hypothetical protein